MKPIVSILGTIAAIALFPHIAQASAYKTSNRSTFIHISELPGRSGSAIGTGYYSTSVGGRDWGGNFQATSVTSSGGIRTYSWQKYSHLLHMTWEALSPSPFTFTLSGLTRLGPSTQLSIPLLNAFGIAFLRMLYAALTSELIN